MSGEFERETRVDVIENLHGKLADLEAENDRLRRQLKRTEDLFDEYGWANVREHLFGERDPFAGLQFDKDAFAAEGAELPRSGDGKDGKDGQVVGVDGGKLNWLDPEKVKIATGGLGGSEVNKELEKAYKKWDGEEEAYERVLDNPGVAEVEKVYGKGRRSYADGRCEWDKDGSVALKRVLGRLASLEGRVESLQNTAGRYDPNLRLDAIERKVEFHNKLISDHVDDGVEQTEFDDEVLARLEKLEGRLSGGEEHLDDIVREASVRFLSIEDKVKRFDADVWGKDVCRGVTARVDEVLERLNGLERDVNSAKARQSWVDKEFEAIEDKVEKRFDKIERHLYYHKVQIASMCEHLKIRNFLTDLNAGKWPGPELKIAEAMQGIGAEDVITNKQEKKDERD